MEACNKVMHSKDCDENKKATALQLSHLGVQLFTCPEGQTQHCLVTGVFEAKVWNDLEIVGRMKCICCNRDKKKQLSGPIQ